MEEGDWVNYYIISKIIEKTDEDGRISSIITDSPYLFPSLEEAEVITCCLPTGFPKSTIASG